MKRVVAGVDEVGRGSLIGPVYAAAVILNKSINIKTLKDSKQLSRNKRKTLFKYIKKNSTWALGKATVKEIEKINILNASLLAMRRAIKKLKKNKKLQRDFVILLAWPEGMVSAANSWYDIFFSNKDKKYRVGHSAAVLINSKEGKAYYFDFGRYHTPQGYGRVRDEETDPDLVLPDINIKSDKIVNLNDILVFLSKLKSTHGEGRLYASLLSEVSFFDAYNYAKGAAIKMSLSRTARADLCMSQLIQLM